MSWINSNATYKQNSKNDLSFYHGFSKTPVEPSSTGTAATTLANASTKGGHTVIGTEVWAEEIPWFGLVASRAAAVTRLSGLTKLNDLVKVDGEGGKVYKYIGADDATFTEAEWSSFWTEVTLTNGMTLNNRHNQPVLRYYLNQPMQTLTTTNNASIDSKGFATRLFVNESDHTGQTSGGSVVSQFAAGTDNIKNGIPSVELNPKLYLGTTEKIAGTHYYDYNVSGTILWSTAVTSSSPKISCFRYIGKTVTGHLSDVDSTIKSHSIDIADIKLALGLDETPDSTTQSVASRVETVEDVIKVLLGLGDSDTITATESIADVIGAAEGRVKATTDALAGRIAALEGVKLSVQVVDAVPATPVVNTLYLVPEEGSTTGTYVEYIAYKPDGSETVTTERIGTTAVDLSGYTTDAEHTALAERVTALDAATTGRVAVVEGKVSTLETTTIPDAIETAKGYTDTKIDTELAEGGSIASAINTAKEQAIANAKVTLTQGTGIIVTPNAEASTSFTIAVSDEVATAASVSALSQVVASNKTELEGKIATAQGAAADALAEAQAKVASVTVGTVPEGVSITTGTTPQLSIITAAKGDSDGDKLITKTHVESIATGYAQAAATSAANAIKGQSLAQTGTLSGMFSVATAGTVGTGITGITITDTGLANAISEAKKAGTDAATAVETLRDTAVASQSVAGAGITVTLAGTVGAPTLTGSVATASYTAATETAAGSWSNDSNVVTGATVKAALADVATAHQKDIDTVTTAITALSTSGFQRIVVDELPTSGIQLNAIYLVPFTTAEKDENVYAEYIYVGGTVTDGVVSGGSFEQIGTTKTDLTEYAKTEDVTATIEALDATETVNGLTVTQVDGKITGLTDSLITASVPAGTTSVEGNVAYVGSEKHVIAPEKFQTAAQMPSTLTSWVADLPNISYGQVNDDAGGGMFSASNQMTTFIGDLSSLTHGCSMFYSSIALNTFIGDLSSLEYGLGYDSNYGFTYEGTGMFNYTNLTTDSIECIADTLSEIVTDRTTGYGCIGITWGANEDVATKDEEVRKEYATALQKIADKGWSVYTNDCVASLVDNTKYEVTTETIAPKTRDINAESETITFFCKK